MFQLAVSVVLLFVATLGVKTLRAGEPTLPADAANILVAEVDVSGPRQAAPVHPEPFLDITLASLARATPSEPRGRPRSSDMERRCATGPTAPREVVRIASAGLVTPGWFDATDTRMLAGRRLADDDLSAW